MVRSDHCGADKEAEFAAWIVRDWIAAVSAATVSSKSLSPRKNKRHGSFLVRCKDEFFHGEVFHLLREIYIIRS